jgi:diguanylate cyclase (GGDEF)-like protein
MSVEEHRGRPGLTGRPIARPPRATAREGAGRLLGFSVFLSGSALACYFLGLSGAQPLSQSQHLPWPLLAAAFAASEAMVVRFELHRDTLAVSLSGVVLVLGLVYAPPGQLLVARLVGELGAFALLRRDTAVKLAVNVSRALLETGLAALVYRAVLDGRSPTSWTGWLAATVAIGAATATATLAHVASVSLASGPPPVARLGAIARSNAITAFVNVVVGILAVLVAWLNPWALLLALVPATLMYVGSSHYAALRRRHAKLASLYQFTDAVSGSLDVQSVVDIVLERSCTLLSAERAELTLVTSGTRARRTTMLAGEPPRSEVVRLGRGSIEAGVLSTGAAAMLSDGTRDEQSRSRLASRHLREALVAPLRSSEGVFGTILVGDSIGEARRFDVDDLRLLETLANHASVALENDRLLAQLRQEAADREHRSSHDALTGLSNRAHFADRVDQAVAAAGDRQVSVLLVDLDRFKEVNDTLGHHNGDLMLREAAARLRRALAARGTVARLGGDEFGVVLGDGASHALEVAQAVHSALSVPFALEEVTFEVTASIGIAVHPLHGSDATTLLQRAEVAMYAAKEARSATRVYAPEQDDYSPRRLALVSELRQAISDAELTVHYQPVTSLSSGEVVGVEALVRWPHRDHGFLPPDEFIPIAEDTGLIRPLTELVLRSALEQCAGWRQRGLPLDVSVNLSVKSLLDGELTDKVAALLQETGLPASSLSLEITETEIMADLSHTVEALNQLSEMGVRLSVDDFGTGYASLSYLQRLPVDEVKIDKSFVLHMSTDANDAVIVRSTVTMAHSLGLRVLAEGVEDRPTWERLRGLGCDLAQGYLVSPALTPSRLESWLEAWDPAERIDASPDDPWRLTPSGRTDRASSATQV